MSGCLQLVRWRVIHASYMCIDIHRMVWINHALLETHLTSSSYLAVEVSSKNAISSRPFGTRDLRGQSWGPNPVPLHITVSTKICWHTKVPKEILDIVWNSGELSQWSAATAILFPKTNKEHSDLLSYIPNALNSCLSDFMERMINIRFISYLAKSSIEVTRVSGSMTATSSTYLVWKSVAEMPSHETPVGLSLLWCGEGMWTTWKYCITMSHLLSLEKCFRDAFARKHQAACPPESFPTSDVLDVTYFGLRIDERPARIARNILSALIVDDLATYFRTSFTAEVNETWNGLRFASHKCKVVNFTET